MGGTVTREPRRLERPLDGSRRRPDLDIILGAQRFLVDVTVRHPAAASNAARGATAALAVAEHAQRKKTAHHTDVTRATRPPAVFVPFVLETFGGFGLQASAFIKTVARATARLAYMWAPTEIVHGLPAAVAITLQRANAKACSDCLRRAVRAVE